MKRLISALMLLPSILFMMTGCTPKVVTGLKIDHTIVKSIKPEKTTKVELFDILGVPQAIAVQGRPAYIFSHGEWAVEYEIAYYPEPQLIQEEPLFELFKSRNILKDIHRVYLYYYTKSTREGSKWPLFINERVVTKIDRLWVLVNEESGIVEDLIFIPSHK